MIDKQDPWTNTITVNFVCPWLCGYKVSQIEINDLNQKLHKAISDILLAELERVRKNENAHSNNCDGGFIEGNRL